MNENDFINVECPHCFGHIIVKKNEINCKIFRHGTHRSNMEPINPHATKNECQSLFESGSVFGCCKPFRLEEKNGDFVAIECDYI